MNAVLLFGLGLLCLIGALVSVIFTIISFANNKTHKYTWLTAFFVCLIALITTVYLIVKKVVHAAQDFAETATEQFGNFSHSMEELSDSIQSNQQYKLQNSPQIKALKVYAKDSSNVPDQFYSYLGYGTYYRFPLPYPYSIHCLDSKYSGELFNEAKVHQFDINDNGEISTGITFITKIAFDKNYLLLEQNIESDRSEKVVQHFILFSFETEKKEEAFSEKELFHLAKQKGYAGSNKLMSLEEYNGLF